MKGNTKAASPAEYVGGLEEPRKSEIALLDRLIREAAPQLEPIMVHGMLGYGPYRYKYESGREGDTAHICLASQKNYISLYAHCEDGSKGERYQARLPKANFGKGCIRFKRVSDLDLEAVRDLVKEAASWRCDG